MTRTVSQPEAATPGWWRPALATGYGDASATVLQREGEGAFRALMCFTFVLLLAPQTMFPWLAPFRPALLAAGAAIASHLFGTMSRGAPAIRWGPEVRLAGLLAAWAIVTIPLSAWPSGSISFLTDIYLKTLTVFWLLSEVVTTELRLRRLAWGLALMSVPLAATAVRNYLGGVYEPNGVVQNVHRIVGYDGPLTGNPNDLALMLNLLLPMGMALLLDTRRMAARWLLSVIVLLDIAAVIATFSRGGFLTLVTILLLHIWMVFRRPWLTVTLVVVAILAVPMLPSGYVQQMGTITNIEADPTGSAQERWGDLVSAAHFVIGHPIIGVGVGMNILGMNDARGAIWRVVHNAYLEHAVELGLPGLALYLALIITCIRSAGMALRGRAGTAGLGNLARAVQISIIAFTVAAFFAPVGYLFYFYYFAGLAVALRNMRRSGEPSHA